MKQFSLILALTILAILLPIGSPCALADEEGYDESYYGAKKFGLDWRERGSFAKRYTMLVIDMSANMKGAERQVKEASKNFCRDILQSDAGGLIAIVVFNQRPGVVCGFTNKTSDLNEAIDGMRDAYGATNVSAVLQKVQQLMDDVPYSRAEKNIALLSDGIQTAGQRGDASAIASKLRGSGCNVYAIGLFRKNHPDSAIRFMNNLQNLGITVVYLDDDLGEAFKNAAYNINNFSSDRGTLDARFLKADSGGRGDRYRGQFKKAYGAGGRVRTQNSDTFSLPDVPKWAEADIREAIAIGFVPQNLLSAYDNGIKRDEFCQLLISMLVARDWLSDNAQNLVGFYGDPSIEPFKDTSDEFVCAARSLGLAIGRRAYIFVPDCLINRAEAAALLDRVATWAGVTDCQFPIPFRDVNYNLWAKQHIDFVSSNDIMFGVENNMFFPDLEYTRAQAIVTMLRLYKTICAPS